MDDFPGNAREGRAPSRPSSADAAELVGRIERLLDEEGTAVLSSCGRDGRPHGSLVGFARIDGVRRLCFATGRRTRKFAQLMENPAVCLTVDGRRKDGRDFRDCVVVSAHGTARVLEGAEAEAAAAVLVARHPEIEAFFRSPGTAVVALEVRRWDHVSRFQDVVVLEVSHG